jgi:hypothetical protein
MESVVLTFAMEDALRGSWVWPISSQVQSDPIGGNFAD